MTSMSKIFAVAAMVAAGSLSTLASAATCVGTCGTGTANGVVTAPPGGTEYGYVSTASGLAGAGQIGTVGGTNGSEFITDVFSANAADPLNFYFNYITSDGTGSFTDYAFAELQTSTGTNVAYLFTARTTPTGNTSPGFGLPANTATLTPGSTPIIPGAPTWSGLGPSSNSCFSSATAGCGYTGWIGSSYAITSAGSYRIRFGVTNMGDTGFQSGLAFNNITVAGNTVPGGGGGTGAVPEPATWAMMIAGFGLVGGAMRRRVSKVAFA
jgi:hypothetical protein